MTVRRLLCGMAHYVATIPSALPGMLRDVFDKNSSLACMVAREESAEDSRMLAILERGCNNTCHCDQSMQRFAEAHGHLSEIEEAMGQFRGVGGKVMVAGKRAIQ